MKKIIYIDMDDVLCDFIGTYNTALKEKPKMKFPQSQYGFWKNLKPIENAIKSVNYLKEHFEVYILSAPSEYNPLSYTEKRVWIEEHLGFNMVNRLILSSHKNLNKGHYLIDDYTEGKGQENFEGQLINFGSKEFPNWDKVISFFKNIVSKNKNKLLYSSECVTLSDMKFVYKNYILFIDFDNEQYIGTVKNFKDKITVNANTLEDLKAAFIEKVNKI